MLDDAKLDPCPGVLFRELVGIRQQVFQRDPREARVRVHNQPRSDDKLHLSFRPLLLQLGRDGLCRGAHVDRRAAHLAAGQLGQTQHVIDELSHALARRAHPLEVLFARAV